MDEKRKIINVICDMYIKRTYSLRLRLEATVLGNLEPIMYTNYFVNRLILHFDEVAGSRILRFYA